MFTVREATKRIGQETAEVEFNMSWKTNMNSLQD